MVKERASGETWVTGTFHFRYLVVPSRFLVRRREHKPHEQLLSPLTVRVPGAPREPGVCGMPPELRVNPEIAPQLLGRSGCSRCAHLERPRRGGYATLWST